MAHGLAPAPWSLIDRKDMNEGEEKEKKGEQVNLDLYVADRPVNYTMHRLKSEIVEIHLEIAIKRGCKKKKTIPFKSMIGSTVNVVKNEANQEKMKVKPGVTTIDDDSTINWKKKKPHNRLLCLIY
ncbi:hypothetical protein OUZ56_000458 [Daphnia magna]|uniref:Uncharacterized protein n=1 Tax=Daphnia magna TaxID=35525 RepID=A0ABQ9ZZX8_9CRUS|nr:hypothetical protein OUZ56_000458 [Daphnia magna]